LRKVAEFSSSLRDDDGKLIPFKFRPFHDLTGNGFGGEQPTMNRKNSRICGDLQYTI
jgi:mannan endo-1,4-beta-mannosidase